MKAIWRGEDDEFDLRNGKEYEIIGYSKAFDAYGVVNETGISYLYDPEDFEITERFPAHPLREEHIIKWGETK